MEADGDPGGFGHRADLDRGGQSADPQDVGLEDIDDAMLDQLPEGRQALVVLAGGQAGGGRAAAQFDVPFEVLGGQRLLDPGQVVGAEALGDLDGVVDVEALYRVEAEGGVGAEEVAGVGDV